MSPIADNLAQANDKITQAAARSGRATSDVELLAVSKTKPIELIEEAASAGQQIFGENRVQELITKVPAMSDDLQWHLIGPLQRNKIRKVLPLVDAIHSVDSLRLAEGIDRVANEIEIANPIPIYLQVNIGQDDAKSGFDAPELTNGAVVEQILSLPKLRLVGLMTVPPIGDGTAESARPHFSALRELRDQIETASGVRVPGLSMGMSGDFEVAIEEGATIVRVGSTLFGSRN